MELSHQQLVLVLTLICCGKKDGKKEGGKKQRITAERRENRQRNIDCDPCYTRTINYCEVCIRMCLFLHQGFIYLHVCVQRRVITAT